MKIKVPATSANIGPGFDCLGIAWDIYNTLEFVSAAEFSVSGCDERFCNENNLAVVGYKSACLLAGVKPLPVAVRFDKCDVPVSRGLGSSATLVVAGALAADRIMDLGLQRDGILRAASDVEGHPDNAAPAVYGGFCAAVAEGSGINVARFDISEKLNFTAVVPDFELLTSLAREALPKSYSRADAVFNIGRIPLLIKALETADAEMLKTALDDRIHQPYRMPLMPGCEKAVALLRELGAYGTCISGAGSTLLCISSGNNVRENIAKTIPSEFPGWKVFDLNVDRDGARDAAE